MTMRLICTCGGDDDNGNDIDGGDGDYGTRTRATHYNVNWAMNTVVVLTNTIVNAPNESNDATVNIPYTLHPLTPDTQCARRIMWY